MSSLLCNCTTTSNLFPNNTCHKNSLSSLKLHIKINISVPDCGTMHQQLLREMRSELDRTRPAGQTCAEAEISNPDFTQTASISILIPARAFYRIGIDKSTHIMVVSMSISTMVLIIVLLTV